MKILTRNCINSATGLSSVYNYQLSHKPQTHNPLQCNCPAATVLNRKRAPKAIISLFPVHFCNIFLSFIFRVQLEARFCCQLVFPYKLPPSRRENAEQQCSGGRSRKVKGKNTVRSSRISSSARPVY